MEIRITPICDEKKCKFKLEVDDNEPEVLEKTGLRIRINDYINKIGKRRVE